MTVYNCSVGDGYKIEWGGGGMPTEFNIISIYKLIRTDELACGLGFDPSISLK
jgi:hypothetical protein